MLVLNLACEAGHGFEGWFGSAADFESQQQRGLLSCPLCNSAQVRRMPSAPRLNLSAAAEPVAPAAAPAPAMSGGEGSGGVGAAALPVALQRQVMQAVRHLMANTEDVGDRFAEEARRIHYGETEARGIRGQATPDEASALAEEGIEVVALPVPDGLKDPLQ
ncbi:hypothetical protein SAMN05216359_10114 [Roseateles sp. YR242]|uniref:DUF1178 family protein n=1 Tax=Roseateles sp. YR242 TaxID=1855305 RepID=UPI0008BD2668|nr:DUF1178 family protein [Roseateles sp. YR242]SEK20830.1 hypothetical protein SAMN05216359_10114 [Roseateles sp. YR242]